MGKIMIVEVQTPGRKYRFKNNNKGKVKMKGFKMALHTDERTLSVVYKNIRKQNKTRTKKNVLPSQKTTTRKEGVAFKRRK